MSSRPQYTIKDWLDLHGLTQDEALKLCQVIRRTYKSQLDAETIPKNERSFPAKLELQACLENIVVPALTDLLGPEAKVEQVIGNVELLTFEPDALSLAHTTLCKEKKIPSVRLVWEGKPENLITLAHETGHAVQMALSNFQFMPPVQREVCAFLSETAVLTHVKNLNLNLFDQLRIDFNAKSKVYLQRNLDRLENDLTALCTAYEYRMNYPFARAVSLLPSVTVTSTDKVVLFSSTISQILQGLASLATR